MSSPETCIYCGTVFDPARGDGDHIIPVQLGAFRGDTRFRRICPPCNNRIGRSEQQLLRCGPEAFMRDVVNPTVPTKRRRGRSRAWKVMGAPGPEFTVDRGDHRALVQPTDEDPQNAHPLDQLVIHDEQGNEYFVRLFPGMRPEQLQERIAKAGIEKVSKAWLDCDAPHWEEYQRLLKAAWPKANMEELEAIAPGVHQVRGGIKLTVTDHYFRAITKIGFHYYLAHTRRDFRGDEACFAPVRDFIMNGGDKAAFFQSSGRTFATPFRELPLGGVLTPHQWCHVLAADETRETAVVYLQFFLGRGCVPRPHYLTLGRLDSPLVCPSFAWGHVYLYDDPQQPGRQAGRVEPAQVMRFRRG